MPLILKLPIACVVKECIEDIHSGLRIQSSALAVLHEAAEAYIVARMSCKLPHLTL